ncbi:hypothetical protein [Peribacillus asahii]|uniref:hypothetical protein n=1 Tax=Peribacillus asahii TaxID=228899 RepID=UPI0037FB46E5
MKHIQNGLVGLGAFIALSQDVNGGIVFLFCLLFWGYDEVIDVVKDAVIKK